MQTQPKPKLKPVRLAGIPTAQGFLPAGTSRETCIDHNRRCKVHSIGVHALFAGYDGEILDEEIGLVAETAGVNEPGSAETRAAVRSMLNPPMTDANPDTAFAESVRDAASQGLPFRYQDAHGDVYVVLALPAAGQ